MTTTRHSLPPVSSFPATTGNPGVHGSPITRVQQMLMVNGLQGCAWLGHRLHLSQHAKLGVWITQAVEHHHANKCLHIDAVAGVAKHVAQAIKAQNIP